MIFTIQDNDLTRLVAVISPRDGQAEYSFLNCSCDLSMLDRSTHFLGRERKCKSLRVRGDPLKNSLSERNVCQ